MERMEAFKNFGFGLAGLMLATLLFLWTISNTSIDFGREASVSRSTTAVVDQSATPPVVEVAPATTRAPATESHAETTRAIRPGWTVTTRPDGWCQVDVPPGTPRTEGEAFFAEQCRGHALSLRPGPRR